MRFPVPALFLAVPALVLPGAAFPAGPGEPLPSAGSERVEVRLVQVEVTAIPRGDGVTCADLRAADLELRVNGDVRPIAGLDRLGAYGLPVEEETPAPTREPGPPVRIVLLFDALSLELGAVSCPPHDSIPPPLARRFAVDWAADWVREGMRPGDLVALGVLGTGVRLLSPWLRRPEDVLAVLDRLREGNDAWPAHAFLVLEGPRPLCSSAPAPRTAPLSWWESLRALLTALEPIPGTKHVLWIGGNRVIDRHSADSAVFQLADLAARVQASRCLLHTVDPFAGRCGGRPIGYLALLSDSTGGEHFTLPRDTARRLRQVAACRFLLSFHVEPGDERRGAGRTIRLTDRSRRFRFHLPGTWERRRDEPRPEERAEAMLLLPEVRRGFDLDARLVPLRPDTEGRNWRGVLLVRLRWRPTRQVTEVPASELVVDMAVQQGATTVAAHHEELTVTDVRDLTADPRGRTWALPVQLHPGRWHDVAAIAHPPGNWHDLLLAAGRQFEPNLADERLPTGAWFRAAASVPPLPGPGEPGPFLLVDRLARVGDVIVPAPAFEDRVAAGTRPLFLAHACSADGATPPPAPGAASLVPEEEEERRPSSAFPAPLPVPVTFTWREDGDRPGCGWWVGLPERAPAPGTWLLRLAPPGDAPRDVLRLRVQPER